ncbi:hypothetical protein [Caulobacter sp. 1776]|uniref:hypothetical protein n=1 Tax=Caulobacter sp. 1776 TaxID=3156420 RepID=UPI00339105AD
MPLPRKPRQKRSPNGTRASRRNVRKRAWLHAKLVERFTALAIQLEERRKYTYRGAYGAISYFKPGEPIPPGYQKVEYDENGDETSPYVKEKAPGLATEGSIFFQEKETPSG